MQEAIMTAFEWIILILLSGFLITSILVLLARNLIVIITAIGLGSVVLSIIFFVLDAPFAGAFELSVGAGLISVLFIIANSVTESAVDEVNKE
jgi:NADH-quinone oxidoreductase subunit J